jgi:hypothetical protein
MNENEQAFNRMIDDSTHNFDKVDFNDKSSNESSIDEEMNDENTVVVEGIVDSVRGEQDPTYFPGEGNGNLNEEGMNAECNGLVPIWEFRNGFAYNETQREYEIFRFYLLLGRARSTVYLMRIYNLTRTQYDKLYHKNNWHERIEAYDRQTFLNACSEGEDTRRRLHEEKLEIYRSQQETIASQSASNSAKILHLIQRKLNKLFLDETENLTIDELVSTGNLAVKLAQLQKELGSQALAVDALLEAIEGDDG